MISAAKIPNAKVQMSKKIQKIKFWTLTFIKKPVGYRSALLGG